MAFGKKLILFIILINSVLLFGGSPLTGQLTELAKMKIFCADFIQTKTIHGLKRPVRVSGFLCMNDKGWFAFHAEKPVRYSCVVRNGTLTQWDEESRKTVKLNMKDHPVLSKMICSSAMFLSGSIEDKTADFHIRHLSERELLIKPKDGSPMKKMIRDLVWRISDDGRYVSRATLTDISGDVTVIEFFSVKLDMPIPEKMWSIQP